MGKKIKCLECSREIYGRSDKKYCSDQCRTNYNNKINRDTTNFMRNINNTLRKNRRILARFNPKGKSKITRHALIIEGFKFSYFTNEYVTKGGRVYRYCYDQGYTQLNDEQYALVVRESYVE